MPGPTLLSQGKVKEGSFSNVTSDWKLFTGMGVFTSKALVVSDVLDAEKALDPSTLI